MAMLVSSLVSEINDTLKTFVREQDQVTSLEGSLDASAVTFTVEDGTQVSKGLVEIDDEMVQVKSVDTSGGVVTIETWGRAEMGSTAASHSDGAKVTTAPVYPRVRVMGVLSDVVQECFPRLYGVLQTTLNANAAVIGYDLPTNVHHVLSVEHMPPGPENAWRRVPYWRQVLSTGIPQINVISACTPGIDNIRVIYARTPPDQLVLTDDLETTYGYTASHRGVFVLGAVARLLGYTEASRIQASTVESHGRSEAVPAGSATAAARYHYQLFRQRLEDEALQLQLRYPIASHFMR
jgi:hypothetical protein